MYIITTFNTFKICFNYVFEIMSYRRLVEKEFQNIFKKRPIFMPVYSKFPQ